MGVYGVILTLAGLLGEHEPEKTGGVNANLWTGWPCSSSLRSSSGGRGSAHRRARATSTPRRRPDAPRAAAQAAAGELTPLGCVGWASCWVPTSTARPSAAWCGSTRDTRGTRSRTSTSPAAARRLRGRPHRRRQQPGGRDRHPEEHRLRVRPKTASARPRIRSCGSAGTSSGDARGSTARRWEAEEYGWERIGRRPHDHAFVRRGGETRTAVVDDRRRRARRHRRAQRLHRAEVDRVGVPRLPARPVHDAARDRRPDPGHRVTARWRYTDGRDRLQRPYGAIRDAAARDLRRRPRLALQQTIYEMGKAVLEAHAEMAEISLSCPNKHHFLVDLSPSAWTTRARCSSRPTGPTA